MILTQLELPAAARSARFELRYRPARGRHELPCWIALPHAGHVGAAPILAIHGIGRGAEEMAVELGASAALAGRAVIAPVFAQRRWPAYQRVVMRGRADLALIRLLDALGEESGLAMRRFTLFGFSGGAQFAHRFAMLYPHRIERLVLASAGWYTMPDDAAAFPYGLAPECAPELAWGSRLAAGLGSFLRLETRVLVGEHDNVPDAVTRSAPELDARQGPDRLTRARRWSEAFAEAARARGIRPRIALDVMPGCGHDFLECVARGGLAQQIVASARLPDATAARLAA